jgi:ATP-binding cassette subfamily F protein uup
MVSHDRYFLDKLATEILHFENGAAIYHAGSYSDFYEDHHRRQEIENEEPPTRKVRMQRAAKPRSVVLAQSRRSVEELEAEIHLLEKELSDLSDSLSDPASDWKPEHYSQISRRQEAIATQLDGLYKEWEAAVTGLPR